MTMRCNDCKEQRKKSGEKLEDEESASVPKRQRMSNINQNSNEVINYFLDLGDCDCCLLACTCT